MKITEKHFTNVCIWFHYLLASR